MERPFTLAVPDLAPWRGGNTGTPGVWSFEAPDGAPGRHVLITALVHGNELCGAWAVADLLKSGLRPHRGRLTLALCNLAAFDRFDPLQPDASRFVEEDLNRQWSPDRLSTGSSVERERARELRPWVAAADWLLDLHSMHEPGVPLSLAGLSPANVGLALRMGSPAHIVVDAGHAEGVRMRDFGPFAPTAPASDARSLLVECGWHGDPHSAAVARDQCLRFVRAAGVCDAHDLRERLAGWALPDPAEQVVLEVTGAVVARDAHFRFLQPYQGMEVIERAGTPIAVNAGETVRTPHDLCVLVMPSVRHAQAGVTVVRYARQVAAGAHQVTQQAPVFATPD